LNSNPESFMFSRQAPASSNTAPVGRDARGWQMRVWVSFALAVSLCGIGLVGAPLREALP
jgi:hypothetical protein